ncbi:Alpha/Beta hydrolase protein [Lasiosphaeris hirsuta]|uniref:Alpha/Beta hydrolase protein n=1 Tax=Lasiosphaeris hirsuta TaxID=260670 RepID=A0AA40ANZ3_9PEZI|nr:Alpha/Beta hydrolase protein [Lasiosphaeris hirsuta]
MAEAATTGPGELAGALGTPGGGGGGGGGVPVDSARLTTPQWAIAQHLKFGAMAFAIQRLLLGPFLLFQRLQDFFTPSRSSHPDIIKTYPARKSLSVRIFFPKSRPKDSAAPLPVLLTVHGGGFVLGHPRDNDDWNAAFASRHDFLVVALNYAKAPGAPFPAPIYDLEALIQAVLADTTLPIDAARVALAGWSAGGNLALAVSQLEGVRRAVRAVVPVYPVVDFAPRDETKTATRRYKPSLGGFRASEVDYLTRLSGLFTWAYLPAGQDYRHPLLSPYYAERDALPRHVFLVGAELDMLGQEAWRMACKLAGKKVPDVTEAMGCDEVRVGKGELILDQDERFAFEETVEGGQYRWLLVPDTIHGFDQRIEAMVRDPALMEDAGLKTEKLIDLIGEWLHKVMGPGPSPSPRAHE